MAETTWTEPSRARAGVLRRPLRSGAFLGVVAAVCLAALAGAVALPHDPHIRYQSFKGTIFERLDWIHDRIAHDDTPIDVLIVGSSRTARGANVAAVERALADRGLPDLRVANLSIPASGFDWRLTVMRDAFRAHPEIRLVIWELVEAFPRDGHQVFEDLGTVGEVLSSPWLINRNLPGNLARLPYRQMELALATAMPDAFGYSADFDPETYPGPAPDHRSFNDGTWAPEQDAALIGNPDHAAALAAESRQRHWEITDPILPGALGRRLEFGVSRYYVDAAAALAEREGAEMAFLFLPFYRGREDVLEADWVQARGAYWPARFLMENPDYYKDAAHASQAGVERITPWLAGQIATALGEAP